MAATNPKTTKRWRDVLPIHPAAELFPLMSEAELREHADDIKANKLQMPIAVCSPDPSALAASIPWATVPPKNLSLLDGRNRLDALELNGIKLVTDDGKFNWSALWAKTTGGLVHVTDEDPDAYVISVNIHRRHLTSEQKRDLIAKLLKKQPNKSNREIARQAKASPTTVDEVRSTVQSGQLPDKTIGKDGKARPTKRKQAVNLTKAGYSIGDDGRLSMPDKLPKAEVTFGAPCDRRKRVFVQETFDSPQAAHGKSVPSPKPNDSNTLDLGSLAFAWREVEAGQRTGNKTTLKAALGNLITEASTVLKTLGGLQ